MAQQAKGLKTLIRLSRFNVDEKQRILVAFQTREDQILAEIAEGERRLLEEQRIAAADVAGIGYLYGAYHRAWMDRREQMEEMLATVRQQIERAQEDLAEAYREQKTYEVTQANREKREREELERKEQLFLDEVGLNIHRRKNL